jgi:cobalamin biosynthetic protein CobC
MHDALATFCTHGGRVADARAAFGEGDWIDLSTGIAPWAWPVGDLPLGWDRLPEPDEIVALESAAGQAFGVGAAQVVAVPGTDLALRLLALVLGAERPAVVVPGYAGHRAAWPDADAFSASLAQTEGSKHDLLVLASPANPDGRTSDPAMLRARAEKMTVVVDEAYADPALGLAPHASDTLIALRSFGKFYGLPGLRLGFVIAGESVAARLRAMLGDWPISSAAVAIGTAAYRDAAWRRTQQARIGETGALLDQVLSDAGLPIIGSAPLFRLVACDRAADLFTHLSRHAILTRPFADQPDRLRIGLPRGAAALVRLATALEEFVR